MGVDEEKLPSSAQFCMACAIDADLRGNRYAAKLYNKVLDDLKALHDLRKAVRLLAITAQPVLNEDGHLWITKHAVDALAALVGEGRWKHL